MTAHRSRPRQIGSALPPDYQSMPIVDACSGTSCKFLQTAARPGAISHERRRPVVPGSRVQTAGRQPTLSATMAAGGVSGSAVTCCVPSRLLRLDSIRRCIPPFWRVLGGTRPGFDLRSTSNRDFGGEATMPSDAAMHSSRHAEREGRSGDHASRAAIGGGLFVGRRN
jgi:hypothetical protein